MLPESEEILQMLQSTSIHRSSPNKATQAPFIYRGQVENLILDGKLDEVVCRRLDSMDSDQTSSILRDAAALKALFTDPGARAALAEAETEHFSSLSLDLGQGKSEFNISKMPTGHFRIVNSEDPGYDVHAQVILMEGGEHAHHAILSTRVPGSRQGEPDLLQTVKMSFTGSGNFVVDSEEIHVGQLRQDSCVPHVSAWDSNPRFKAVDPFRK